MNGNDDMVFAWEDGSRISNTYGFNADNSATTGQGPWNNGEPNEYEGDDEDCVHMYGYGKYNDRPCSDERSYPLCMNVLDDEQSSVAFFAKSVDEKISYPDNNGAWINKHRGQDFENHIQYHDSDDWMNRYYGKYKDNYQNNDMHIWVICGLMIVNIICLSIYCMDNNKCKWSKKEKDYRAVKYESEDIEV